MALLSQFPSGDHGTPLIITNSLHYLRSGMLADGTFFSAFSALFAHDHLSFIFHVSRSRFLPQARLFVSLLSHSVSVCR